MSNCEILDGFHNMAARITPELERLYIIEQPPTWPTPQGCDAYALYPHCNAVMRDHLISTGQWHGPAPIIVFTTPLDYSSELQAILIHELAHATPSPSPIFDIEPSPVERQLQAAHFQSFTAPDIPKAVPKWDGHSLFFIRRCLHLFIRALNCGLTLRLTDINVAGEHYGLSDARLYLRALGDEPDRLRHLSFAEIQAIKPPFEFTRLWWSDTRGQHDGNA